MCREDSSLDRFAATLGYLRGRMIVGYSFPGDDNDTEDE